MRKMLARFLSDLSDLWVLIRHGQPAADELLPWRMAAEFAKMQPPAIELDLWEQEQFAANPRAFWFDPARYDDGPFAWPKKGLARPAMALDHVRLFAAQQAQSQAAYATHVAALQGASVNPYSAFGQLQNPYGNYGGLGQALGIGSLF